MILPHTKKQIRSVHLALSGFAFFCMIQALYYPFVGHPRWWQIRFFSEIGWFIGIPPLLLGRWLIERIPALMNQPFAWSLALAWALIIPLPISLGLNRLTSRSSRTPPALPGVLFLGFAISAPLIASVQAGPLSFLR